MPLAFKTVIHVQVEHGIVEILAAVGAKVYYTKDGTIPAGKNSMELYLGPFTLRPGLWSIVATAKHAGQLDRCPPTLRVCATILTNIHFRTPLFTSPFHAPGHLSAKWSHTTEKHNSEEFLQNINAWRRDWCVPK